MRRIFLLIITSVWLSVNATNTLSLSVLSGHPGETLTVSVSLTNNEAVTALQATIPLGANMQYITNSASLNAARANGHQLVAAATDDTLRIAVFSLMQAALNGNEGELLTFQVKLRMEPATYPLKAELTLAGVNSQQLIANVEQGSITLLSPKIEVVTQSLDYGHIPIRATYTKTLQVRNTGNEPLHISDVLFSAAEFSVEETAYTISAGATQNIVITFAPQLHGAITENVRLRSDAINDPDVYGANICQLVADPFSVNELRMQAASGISDDTVIVKVRMNNMEPIVGAQFSLKMPSALAFIEGSAEALNRAAEHSVLSTLSNDTLTLILYHPLNEAVTGDDGDLLCFKVRLDGKSGNYALKPINTLLVNAVHANMVSAVYNANVTIQSPTISGNTSADFGHLRVDQPYTITYAIRNTGQVPLTVEWATFLSEGLRVVTELPIVIARNATQNIEIELTPWQEGNFSTTMQVYSNDPACRMKSVTLTADIYEPNSLSFRGFTYGNEYHLSVALSNYSDITGVQFDVEGLKPWTSYALTERTNGYQIVVHPIDETHHRVIIFAMNNVAISGHEGAIIEWTWDASLSSAMNGQTISMENVVLVHPSKGNREAEAATLFVVDYQPEEGTAIDNVNLYGFADRQKLGIMNHKFIKDGQLYILRDGKTYTVQGAEVK